MESSKFRVRVRVRIPLRRRTRITGLRGVREGPGGLPPWRSTDDQRQGSAVATLRIASVEKPVWCGRLARNDDVIGPNNVEGWHARPSAAVAMIDGTASCSAELQLGVV
jgi:hypothetical protein